jgi:NAD(P)-dependent dehydrogenase (short-subunit alcohol dehydrogenase family)
MDMDKIATRVPLGRVGAAPDMAGVCVFLASPAAAWISGAIIPVDGGHLSRGLDLPVGED